MAYRAVYQLKASLDCSLSYILDLFRLADAFNLGVSTELQIYFVCVVDHFLSVVFSDKVRQVAAHLTA